MSFNFVPSWIGEMRVGSRIALGIGVGMLILFFITFVPMQLEPPMPILTVEGKLFQVVPSYDRVFYDGPVTYLNIVDGTGVKRTLPCEGFVEQKYDVPCSVSYRRHRYEPSAALELVQIVYKDGETYKLRD